MSGTHHLLKIPEGLLLQRVEDLVRLHYAEQVVLRVDDGKSHDTALLNPPRRAGETA